MKRQRTKGLKLENMLTIDIHLIREFLKDRELAPVQLLGQIFFFIKRFNISPFSKERKVTTLL